MPWAQRQLLLALLPVASALLTPSPRPLLRTPTMVLRRTVGTCCCGGADTDESSVSSDEVQQFSQPLLPKRGVEGLPPNAATRSRLISMDEAGPSDSDGDDGGPLMATSSVYMTLAVLVLLATANQWSRAIIFYIVDFSKGARSQPDLFINVALGFDEASYGLTAPNPKPYTLNPNPNPKLVRPHRTLTLTPALALALALARYGLIASLAFSALFASTSLLAGAAVDRVDARSLLAGS